MRLIGTVNQEPDSDSRLTPVFSLIPMILTNFMNAVDNSISVCIHAHTHIIPSMDEKNECHYSAILTATYQLASNSLRLRSINQAQYWMSVLVEHSTLFIFDITTTSTINNNNNIMIPIILIVVIIMRYNIRITVFSFCFTSAVRHPRKYCLWTNQMAYVAWNVLDTNRVTEIYLCGWITLLHTVLRLFRNHVKPILD